VLILKFNFVLFLNICFPKFVPESKEKKRKEKRRKIIVHNSMFHKPKSLVLGLTVGWEFSGLLG
jgi:hypothetical protein